MPFTRQRKILEAAIGRLNDPESLVSSTNEMFLLCKIIGILAAQAHENEALRLKGSKQGLSLIPADFEEHLGKIRWSFTQMAERQPEPAMRAFIANQFLPCATAAILEVKAHPGIVRKKK